MKKAFNEKNSNKPKKDSTFLRYECRVWGKRVGLFIVLILLEIIICLPAMKAFVDTILGIATQLSYDLACILKCQIWTVYIGVCIIGMIFLCCLSCKIVIAKLPISRNYDAEYLNKSLLSDNKHLPATSREGLLRKVVGEKEITEKYEKMITDHIDQNIGPINSFLSCNDENILAIQAPWGTGKTTSLLIAINEFKDNEGEYKYIYESAFKYTNGLSEYFHDILGAICQVLDVYGVKVKSEAKDLLNNISPDPPKTFLKTILSEGDMPPLSSNVIYSVNQKVEKKAYNLKIIVVLDDLDRLDGDDIIEALSFLSILRRLSFIKIILPLDSKAIIAQLAGKVYQPRKFIQKYLPDQTSLHLKSNYEMVENVAIVTIKEKMKISDEQLDLCYPIWEATLISMISKRIRGELDQSREYRYNWLSSRKIGQYDNNNEWLHGVVLAILNAPHYASGHVKSISPSDIGQVGYYWDGHNNIRQFQHIIWALYRRDKGNALALIRNGFTEEDYREVVASWVRNYVRDNWGLLGFTLRDVINTIMGEEEIKIADAPGECFVNAFNTFFQNTTIKYDPTNETDEA
ncbi:hypothetical protein IKE72_01990 [Candidatus Saccharibacteria bacterium]|nr:hypothetical protein [Candidatus Saccharibacteria bacterium]